MTSTTNAPNLSWTVDRKLTLSLLLTMLTTFIGAIVYVTNFRSEVDKLNDNLVLNTDMLNRVTIAIERNTAQIVKGDRTIAILETMVKDQARRIANLESQIK